MIRITVFMIALAVPGLNIAQTPVRQSVPVRSGQTLELYFDYPKIIRISTWDKNEISVDGTVSINGGEHDDAFLLHTSTSGNTITIRNEIKDMKQIPHRITVRDGAQTIVFKNKEELQRYKDAQGRSHFERTSWGPDIEIVLDIKVPHNLKTQVESVYGMVEVADFSGPISVTATYGGVDVAVKEVATGEIVAETNFGEIYSNLEAQFGGKGNRNEAFHTYVRAQVGKGPDYTLVSKYGNVYLRKAKE